MYYRSWSQESDPLSPNEHKDFRSALKKGSSPRTPKRVDFESPVTSTKPVTTIISDQQVTEEVQPETVTTIVQETQPETQIIEVPQDISVREGEPARFSCLVKGGVPPPGVRWLFEGRPVTEGDVYRLDDDGRGRHSLLIPECFPEDAGLYTVHVENSEAKASAYLTVRELFTEETAETTTTLTIEQQEEAATKIQAAFRGMQAREKVKAMKVEQPSGTPSPANPSQPITRDSLSSVSQSESSVHERDSLGDLPVLDKKGTLPLPRRDSGEFESLRKESVVSEDDDYEVMPARKYTSLTTERQPRGESTQSSSDFWAPDEDFLVLAKPLKRYSRSPQRDDPSEVASQSSESQIKYANLDFSAMSSGSNLPPRDTSRLKSEDHEYLELVPDLPKRKESHDYVNPNKATKGNRSYVNVTSFKSGDESNASYDDSESDDYEKTGDHSYINVSRTRDDDYLEPIDDYLEPVSFTNKPKASPMTTDDVQDEYIHPIKAGIHPPHPKAPKGPPPPVQKKPSGKPLRTFDDQEERYLRSQVGESSAQRTSDSATESEDDYLKPIRSPSAGAPPALPTEAPPPAPPPPLDSSFDDFNENDAMDDHFLGLKTSGELQTAAGGPEVSRKDTPAESESESETAGSESKATWSGKMQHLELPAPSALISDEEYIDDTESDGKHMLDSESDSSEHLSEMEIVGSPEVSQIIHHTIWSAMKHSDDSGSDSDQLEAAASRPPPTIHVSASDDDKVASRSEMCATDEEKLDKAKALKSKPSQDVTVGFACVEHPPVARVEPFFKDPLLVLDKHDIGSSCDKTSIPSKSVGMSGDLEDLALQMMSDVMVDAFQFITHPKQQPVGEAPSFVKMPEGINVVIGDTIYIECTIAGSPEPTVSWLKNGAELVGERYITTYENFTTSLTIHNCVIEDQAEYTIRLMNEFGISELTVQVLIDYEMPRFDQPLQDAPAPLDGTAVFECRVGGRPEPDTVWHIFGVELTDREKYYMERTETIHRLYVRHVTVDDSQMSYTVRAFNAAGFVESSANIILQDDSLATSTFEKTTALSPEALAYSIVMAIVLLNLLQSPSLVFMLTVTIIALLLGYLILHGNLNM